MHRKQTPGPRGNGPRAGARINDNEGWQPTGAAGAGKANATEEVAEGWVHRTAPRRLVYRPPRGKSRRDPGEGRSRASARWPAPRDGRGRRTPRTGPAAAEGTDPPVSARRPGGPPRRVAREALSTVPPARVSGGRHCGPTRLRCSTTLFGSRHDTVRQPRRRPACWTPVTRGAWPQSQRRAVLGAVRLTGEESATPGSPGLGAGRPAPRRRTCW